MMERRDTSGDRGAVAGVRGECPEKTTSVPDAKQRTARSAAAKFF